MAKSKSKKRDKKILTRDQRRTQALANRLKERNK